MYLCTMLDAYTSVISLLELSVIFCKKPFVCSECTIFLLFVNIQLLFVVSLCAGSLNCAAFTAGMLEAVLNGANFVCFDLFLFHFT